MTDIEPGDGEIPTRKLTWKPSGWLSHIKCRTIDDRFPLTLWEVWFSNVSLLFYRFIIKEDTHTHTTHTHTHTHTTHSLTHPYIYTFLCVSHTNTLE
jgi:hypothetical protein